MRGGWGRAGRQRLFGSGALQADGARPATAAAGGDGAEDESNESASPSVNCFNTIVKGWLHSKRMDKFQRVEELVSRMTAMGSAHGLVDVSPDRITFSLLISSYAQQNVTEKESSKREEPAD